MQLNIASDYYVDPETYIDERERLFSTSWQLLGPESALNETGSYISEEFAGVKIIALRGRDGQIRAFRNVCSHRGAPLVDRGAGTCRTLRCPYHHWNYDDTGRLVNAPWFGDDSEFKPEQWSLNEVEISSWRGLLFVCLQPEKALEEHLQPIEQELADVPLESYVCADREQLSFTGNWKIYTDNFVEGYHIPGIHPEFFAAIDFEKFVTTAHTGYVKMTAPAREDLFYKGRWYWMWPNWTLSLFEGGMNTSRINPISAHETELIYHFYFDAEHLHDASFRQNTIQRNLKVIKEDFKICFDIHQNYQSGGYQSGPLSPRHEQGVHYFQSMYLQSILSEK